MSTSTNHTQASEAKGFDDKLRGQVAKGKAKLDRRLHDVEKTNAKRVARAKREIKADVAKIKKAAAKLGHKFKKNKK